jgi:hypothetical protein
MRQVFRMKSGHSPFLSDPDRVAAILAQIADAVDPDVCADAERLQRVPT